MKLAKTFAYGICSFALATAAWAGDGLQSSSEYAYPSTSEAASGSYSGSPWGATQSDSSATGATRESYSEPATYIVVEEWYIFPSSEEIPLGG